MYGQGRTVRDGQILVQNSTWPLEIKIALKRLEMFAFEAKFSKPIFEKYICLWKVHDPPVSVEEVERKQ